VALRRVGDRGRFRVERGDDRKDTNVNHPARSGDMPISNTRGDERVLPGQAAPHRRRVPLTEEQRELAVNYLPMARQLARRLHSTWPFHREELESTAYMALVEAAQTFDPSRGVGFGTYARHRIRGALRDLQRVICSGKSRAAGATAPVFQKLKAFDEHNGMVLGVEPDPPVGTWIESTEAVEFWLRRLPRAHAAACRLIYIHGKSQDQVAVEIGCSKSYLSRLHREAINSLIRDYHVVAAAHEGCARPSL
jgi:RNA polymerase sigma factor (sigma-70 family)